jgi:hypothetical protein
MKPHILAAAFTAFLVVASPPSGSAQDSLQVRQREAMMACTEDRIRLCSNVLPGGGRVVACMQFHAEKLSQRCFQAMTAWGLAVANAFKACQPDADRLCPGLPLRGPRGRACMTMNITRLGRACLDALFGAEPFNGAAKSCQPDAARVCPHVPPAGPGARLCLLQNADRLSAACRDALLDEEPFIGRPDPKGGPIR